MLHTCTHIDEDRQTERERERVTMMIIIIIRATFKHPNG